MLTGSSAAKIFDGFKDEIKVEGLEFEVVDVKNEFFGDKINVSGLVTGFDIERTIKENKVENAIIPSVMLREGTDEFLDGIKIRDLKKKFPDVRFFVINDCYKFEEILKIINSL